MTTWGYARESTSKQQLGMRAQVDELKKAGCERIIKDKGQSGETNLIESTEWQRIADEIRPGDTLKVWSQSRLGRQNYEVAFVIGRLTKEGIVVHILEEGRVITDMDDFTQNATMTLRALTDHAERVEIRKRTVKALSVLKNAGVKLGRKPALTDKDIANVLDLHSRGLGYASIGKVVRTKRQSDGAMTNTSPRVVKAVVAGEYVSREEWERRNSIARLTMLGAKS